MNLEILDTEARIIFEKAEQVAKQEGTRKISVSDIVMIMMAEYDEMTNSILRQLNVDSFTYLQMNMDKLKNYNPEVDVESELNQVVEASARHRKNGDLIPGSVTPESLFREIVKKDTGKSVTRTQTKPESRRTNALDACCTDLNECALRGEIDPVIGRDRELLLLETTLLRMSKNNAILIGETGVGKSAIVEGLAVKIASGEIPEALAGKRILKLSPTLILSKSAESSLSSLITELKGNKDVILFVEDVHKYIGKSQSFMENMGLLKPAIASGDIKIIGVTTSEEYKKNIEQDASFERNLQKIEVEELGVEKTIEVLHNLKSVYEQHHELIIQDDALTSVVNLSQRYIGEKCQPYKSTDLLDMACARAKFSGEDVVTEDSVRTVISDLTGIPVTRLDKDSKITLRELDKKLATRVFGQEEAIKVVSDCIRRNRINLSDATRPIGSFYFTGKTGSGKTELAKAIAQTLMGSEDALIRIDMSEYQQEHNVSRLIGPPPGYVGYEAGGQLTNAVMKKPYSVILLDEVEKAHPRVFEVLLQLLDDGRLTDGMGHVVDFKNTVIIMTSNLGSNNRPRVGFGSSVSAMDPEDPMPAVKSAFSPEFINRIDAVVAFNPLDESILNKIATKLLGELSDNLQQKGYMVTFDPSVAEYILQSDTTPEFGARPIRRAVETKVIDEITMRILEEEIVEGKPVTVCIEDGKFCLR